MFWNWMFWTYVKKSPRLVIGHILCDWSNVSSLYFSWPSYFRGDGIKIEYATKVQRYDAKSPKNIQNDLKRHILISKLYKWLMTQMLYTDCSVWIKKLWFKSKRIFFGSCYYLWYGFMTSEKVTLWWARLSLVVTASLDI